MQEAAAEAVAAAMNATLPGIDANDEGKTRAVFRFYCMVLATTSSLAVSGGHVNTPLQYPLKLEHILCGLLYIPPSQWP